MALEIKENRGIYELSGRLTSQNVGAVKAYFRVIAETCNEMVISLENIAYIDTSGARCFELLYKEISAQNKVIAIVGRQNNIIAEVMQLTNTSYILSNDRV